MGICWTHGSLTKYPFGDNVDALGEYAWFDQNSTNKTQPVGQRKPNQWGLYDMLGNVWEWCQDGYVSDYYWNSPPTDPPGEASASSRLYRGGSWKDSPGAMPTGGPPL